MAIRYFDIIARGDDKRLRNLISSTVAMQSHLAQKTTPNLDTSILSTDHSKDIKKYIIFTSRHHSLKTQINSYKRFDRLFHLLKQLERL